LHPDEITSLISTYHAAQAAKGHDLKKVKETAPKFYQTDANKVSPPTKILKDGVEVEFKDLPPEEQAKELVKHQIKTVAMSLAARDLLTKDLVAKGTPEELATRLADIQLSPQRDEHGEAANKTAEKLFHEALAIGPSPVSTSVVEKTLKSITNPAALKAAVAYFQACDYQEAREKYLEPGSEEHISEHQEPSAIANQLINAVKALRKRSGSYPDGSTTVDMAGLFQNRVMKHLGTLAPEKVPLIQNVLDVEDNEQYDEAVKKHHKAIKKYEAQQAKLQEAYDKKFNVVNDHYLELFSPVKIDAKKLRTEGEEEFDLGGDTSAWDTEHTIETPSGSRIIGVLHRGDNPGYDDHHFKTKVLPGIVDAAKKALSAGKKVKFLAEGMKGGGEYSEQRAIAHALGALGADVSQDTWDDESVAPWEGYPDDSNPVITPTLPIVRSLTQFSGGDSDLAIAGLYATLVGQGDEIKLTPSIKKTLKSLSIDPEDKDALYAATFPSDTGGKPNPLSRIADEYNRIRQENLLTKIKQEEGNGVVAIATPGASHAYALKPFVERTFKKQGKPPKIPQGISAVMEEKGIFAPQEPIKPPRYDLKRKKPEELTEDASQMWGDFALRFASSKRQAARVVLKHFFYPYSIYPDTSAMGQQRQAVYWGVDPNKDAISYPGWEQAQARDLGERDYNRILTAAREWLRTPVLSKNIEGVVRDTQLRAALDLAVRTEWYESALHPTVYNNLLAKLAGVSQNETLVTVRSASAGKGTVRNNMTMPKFAGKNADQLLARLDRMASTIQDNHETWGMPFPVAKGLVNDIDKMADEIEEASFGVDSLLTRQTEIIAKTAEVIQRDTDEPYMDSFKNPHEPVQTEADEPYMSAYSNDDSSDVRHGKTDTGRPLAP
jgi:tetratricopeptide (TPR) repeat protein